MSSPLRTGAVGFAALVAVASMLLLLGTRTVAAQESNFTIEIDDVAVEPGAAETVVQVRLVPNGEIVAALSLAITADPTLLATVASSGSGTSFDCPFVNGSVRFAGFDAPGWSGPVTLCEITVAGTGASGSGSFAVEIKAATNADTVQLTGAVVGGAIQVGGTEPTPAPEPSATPTPTPEPETSAAPEPTQVRAVDPGPTATPEPSATPTATPEAEASPNQNESTSESEDDTTTEDPVETSTAAPDPNVELDPDIEDDSETNDPETSDSETSDSDRGTRAPSQSPTPGAINTDDGGVDSDVDASTPDDDGDDDGADEQVGEVADGAAVATNSGGGSSNTALLAAAAVVLLALGSAVGIAARRADQH